jgi:hypothetical protein
VPYVTIIDETYEEEPEPITYRLEVADRWPDGTVDTFPDEDEVGAICHPGGKADIYIGETHCGEADWYDEVEG